MKLRDFYKKMASEDVYPNDDTILKCGDGWSPEQLDLETTIILDLKDEDFTVAEVESVGFIVNDAQGSHYYETLECIVDAYPSCAALKQL